MGLLLLIILLLLIFGAFPGSNGYNQNWGYGPSGIIGLILLIVIVLVVMGEIPHNRFNW